jgi:hypothetical protein
MGFFSSVIGKKEPKAENKYKDADAVWDYVKQVDKRFYMDVHWNKRMREGQIDPLNVIFQKEGREPELLVCSAFSYLLKAEPAVFAAQCLLALLIKKPLADIVCDNDDKNIESIAKSAAALESMYKMSSLMGR